MSEPDLKDLQEKVDGIKEKLENQNPQAPMPPAPQPQQQPKANAFSVNEQKILHTFGGVDGPKNGQPTHVIADCRLRVSLQKAFPYFIDMRIDGNNIVTQVPKGKSICPKCTRIAGYRLKMAQEQSKPISSIVSKKQDIGKDESKVEECSGSKSE